MDHANYTSYPKELPQKRFKNLNETFNTKNVKVAGKKEADSQNPKRMLEYDLSENCSPLGNPVALTAITSGDRGSSYNGVRSGEIFSGSS